MVHEKGRKNTDLSHSRVDVTSEDQTIAPDTQVETIDAK